MVGLGKGSSHPIYVQKHYVFPSTLLKSADTTPILVDVQPLVNLLKPFNPREIKACRIIFNYFQEICSRGVDKSRGGV
jgi:hypothetical protein